MGTVKTGGDRRDGIAKTGRTAVPDANKTKVLKAGGMAKMMAGGGKAKMMAEAGWYAHGDERWQESPCFRC
jgi:hypothetical protein